MKKDLVLFFISIVIVIIVTDSCNFLSEKDENYTENSYDREFGKFDSLNNKNGIWEGYYSNGKIAYTGNYDHGLFQGQWKYFDENGQLVKLEEYRKGKLDGKVLMYDKGIIYDEITYVNGKKSGEHKHYSKTGNINYLQEYFNDSMTGRFVIYSATGKIVQEGYLKNAKNVGEWHMYDENGILTEINIYDSLKNKKRVIKMNINHDTLSEIEVILP